MIVLFIFISCAALVRRVLDVHHTKKLFVVFFCFSLKLLRIAVIKCRRSIICFFDYFVSSASCCALASHTHTQHKWIWFSISFVNVSIPYTAHDLHRKKTLIRSIFLNISISLMYLKFVGLRKRRYKIGGDGSNRRRQISPHDLSNRAFFLEMLFLNKKSSAELFNLKEKEDWEKMAMSARLVDVVGRLWCSLFLYIYSFYIHCCCCCVEMLVKNLGI